MNMIDFYSNSLIIGDSTASVLGGAVIENSPFLIESGTTRIMSPEYDVVNFKYRNFLYSVKIVDELKKLYEMAKLNNNENIFNKDTAIFCFGGIDALTRRESVEDFIDFERYINEIIEVKEYFNFKNIIVNGPIGTLKSMNRSWWDERTGEMNPLDFPDIVRGKCIAINNGLKKECSKYPNIIFIRFDDFLIGSDGFMLSEYMNLNDGLHLNHAGLEIYRKKIFDRFIDFTKHMQYN